MEIGGMRLWITKWTFKDMQCWGILQISIVCEEYPTCLVSQFLPLVVAQNPARNPLYVSGLHNHQIQLLKVEQTWQNIIPLSKLDKIP